MKQEAYLRPELKLVVLDTLLASTFGDGLETIVGFQGVQLLGPLIKGWAMNHFRVPTRGFGI